MGSPRVWIDKWIFSHPNGIPYKLTASGKWNEELIREIFCTFDADAILLTHVNSREASNHKACTKMEGTA
jgi:hypothetical protein